MAQMEKQDEDEEEDGEEAEDEEEVKRSFSHNFKTLELMNYC